MALSQQEQSQLKALIAREGGLSSFQRQLTMLAVAAQQANAQAALSPAITVTVQDWAAIGAFLSQPSNLAMASVMSGITAAAGAKDAAALGPLFVQLYAAVKAGF